MKQTSFELTPKQKGILATLSRETGKPVPALLDEALDVLQEREHVGHTASTTTPPQSAAPKPIWEQFAEAFDMDDFIPTGMTHSDFFIGREFLTGAGQWRCTDVGTRVIVAMRIDDHPDDPSWYNGPPYAVAECVFDEYDQQACTPLPPPEVAS